MDSITEDVTQIFIELLFPAFFVRRHCLGTFSFYRYCMMWYDLKE